MPDIISPYITKAEYACRCCGRLPEDIDTNFLYDELFDTFRFIREEWGKPIPITSGFRCPTHNQAIGGSPLSVHMMGLALDLDCADVREVIDLRSVIEDVASEVRMGVYTNTGSFIHIDVGYLINPSVNPNWKEGVRWFK